MGTHTNCVWRQPFSSRRPAYARTAMAVELNVGGVGEKDEHEVRKRRAPRQGAVQGLDHASRPQLRTMRCLLPDSDLGKPVR